LGVRQLGHRVVPINASQRDNVAVRAVSMSIDRFVRNVDGPAG
jgi:hypothetical protein